MNISINLSLCAHINILISLSCIACKCVFLSQVLLTSYVFETGCLFVVFELRHLAQTWLDSHFDHCSHLHLIFVMQSLKNACTRCECDIWLHTFALWRSSRHNIFHTFACATIYHICTLCMHFLIKKP